MSSLLLNLSLTSLGKEKFKEIKYSVLNLLNLLMDHPNEDIKTYINGCLYSLFSVPEIRKLAQEMKF